jgi:hypothetical protein
VVLQVLVELLVLVGLQAQAVLQDLQGLLGKMVILAELHLNIILVVLQQMKTPDLEILDLISLHKILLREYI